jgi:tight adherence protein B
MTSGIEVYLIAALVALAATCVVMVVANRVAERRERKRLLHRISGIAAATSKETGGVAPAEIFRESAAQAGRWWKLMQRAPYLQDSNHLLEQAGLDWSTARLARLVILSASVFGLAAFAFGRSGGALLVGMAVGMLLPVLYVRRRRTKRRQAIEAQLPEAIDLLGRAIRAGHALSTGLRLVAEESPDPIATEFRRVFEEQRYGMPFEESLLGLTRRVDLVDVRVMVVAILVQREVGGNLAEILDNIARLIRTRFSLRRQVKVYTAQGRMSGYVLGVLPIALAAVLYAMNPDYMKLLVTDPTGRMMVAVALGLQAVGYFWISRILKLDL